MAAPRTERTAQGHRATSPWRIPRRGWRQVLGRVLRHAHADRLMLYAAGISFFALLSIAPVLVTAVSVYAAINTPEDALAQLAGVVQLMPPELRSIVTDQLTTITTASTHVLTVRGIIGLVVALWTATTAAVYLVDALTLAYHETETRSFLRRAALAAGIVLGGALLLGAVLAVADLVSGWLDAAPAWMRGVAPVLTWLVLAAVMAAGIDVLYRYAPDRKRARLRWINPGAVVATLLWLGTSAALLSYAQTLGTYEATYGSLAGVAISMFWLWLTFFEVILGAAVNAEAERQTGQADGTPPPSGEPS